MQLGFQHTYPALPSRFYARVDPTPVRIRSSSSSTRAGGGPGTGSGRRRAARRRPSSPAISSRRTRTRSRWPTRDTSSESSCRGWATGAPSFSASSKGATECSATSSSRARASRPSRATAMAAPSLGPMLREYLISEAMHALGIPTTRSLAVVTTGERVYREEPLPGAVLTRVAASHVRVGTFQYFAARGDQDGAARAAGLCHRATLPRGTRRRRRLRSRC